MKITIVFALYVSLWDMCFTSAEMNPQNAISRSNWEFTTLIYTKISRAANPEGNIIVSPLSVQVILALCSMGAGGETAKQILKGLDVPDSTDDIKIGFKRLLQSLPSSGKASLEIVNQIFPAVQYHILKTFNDTAQEFFSSDVANINYENSTYAASTINKWVEEKSLKKISDIVSAGGLDANTSMVLVNAVYFEGERDVGFDKENTTLGMFYVNGNVKKEMNMTQCERKFNFDINTDVGAKLLEVPYMNNTMTFFIILPLEKDGLPSLEANLAALGLKAVYESSKQYVDVHLSLPIFSINQSFQLNHILEELGIVDMFGKDADFSGMSPETGLSVSKVLHKAMFEVNGEGTVEAAEVQPAAGSSPQGERFVVDHPFTFALISKLTNVVLFVGRYTGDEGETRFTYDRPTPKGGNNSTGNLVKISSVESGDEDLTLGRSKSGLSPDAEKRLRDTMELCTGFSLDDYTASPKQESICPEHLNLIQKCKDQVNKGKGFSSETMKSKCGILGIKPTGSFKAPLKSSWIMMTVSLAVIGPSCLKTSILVYILDQA